MYKLPRRRSKILDYCQKNGYWRIEVKEMDKLDTTFILHHFLYQFTEIPFTLKMASPRSSVLYTL